MVASSRRQGLYEQPLCLDEVRVIYEKEECFEKNKSYSYAEEKERRKYLPLYLLMVLFLCDRYQRMQCITLALSCQSQMQK